MRLFFVSFFIAVTQSAFGQPSVSYHMDLENIHHHEVRITAEFTDIRMDTLIIRMPNTSPGRYAEHNFVKNVYSEQAFNRNGKKIQLERISPYAWKLPVEAGFAQFSYTLYGNHADGTYTGVDARKLHLNMPATFVYGVGLDEIPVHLVINLKDKTSWSVATQLVKMDDSTFSAPNYYYFFDSPTMVGDIDWRSWKVDSQTIEVAMMHEGTESELDAYVEWIKRIVNEQKNVYGELPEFDYGRYTFLISYNPWVYGDGMEHRNSTICTSSGSLANNAEQLIGTVSHEFFHAWNIERIRPKSLEPFDFDHPNLTGALWFGEGFTSYYDNLTLVRAKIKSPETYLSQLTYTMNYVVNSPGRSIRNPIEMSYNAPFVDAATANDATNYPNTFVSYYSYGAVLGLGLDLLLRTRYEGLTLDDYMKYIWQTYGKPENPYTIDDLERALATVTKDTAFAHSFFARYVYQSDLPDFERLLAQFGISMESTNPGGVDISNIKLDNSGTVISPVLKNSSLYEAGVETGDQLLSINGEKIASIEDLSRISGTLEVGQRYEVEFRQLGHTVSSTLVAQADPSFRLIYLPDTSISKQVRKRRDSWLKWK